MEYHAVGKTSSQYLHTRNGLYYVTQLPLLVDLKTKLRLREGSTNKRITKSTYNHHGLHELMTCLLLSWGTDPSEVQAQEIRGCYHTLQWKNYVEGSKLELYSI